MKPVKFGNEKALQLTNSLLIRELNNKITSTYNVDIEYKRYHFLDKTRATELKQKEHSFVLNTFGTKYLLFLTHVNFKQYAIYINRKNSTFFLIKTRFKSDLYSDTLLEGETVKINEKWYFLMSDCLVFKGEQMVMKKFSQRYSVMTDILNNQYVSDPYMEPFYIILKDMFSYREIIDVKEKYIPSLPFNVNGYLFKCEDTASYDILYIFPECRNKSIPVVKDDSPKNEEGCTIETGRSEDKNEATFVMKSTEFPDVYEIFMFDKAKGKKIKVGYSGIPNLSVSKMVRQWFEGKEEGFEFYVKFKKEPLNEKWIPQHLVQN